MSASSPPLWRRSRRLRWITYAIGALALLTLASWLAVPPIVRAQLESRLTAALGRQTSVEAVAFNPFKLQLTLSRLAIAGRTGPHALLAVDEIVANLSSASIWHRAPVLDALRITRPSVSLARDREGRYSIQDLIEAPSTGPPGPPSFSLNNIEVVDGSIAFDDGVTGRKQEITALDIGIPFLSTLAYQTDVRVTPRMSGSLNGTRFTLGGSTTPFAEPREAALDIELDALPLAPYVAYLPARPSFEVAGGALTTHLKLAFVAGKPGERRLELRGDAQVDALELKRPDGSMLAAAQRIAVAIERIDLYGNDARIASIALDAPEVDVRRLADGALEWARPLAEAPAPAPAPAPPPASGATPPWNASIGKFAIARGAVTLADQTSGFESKLVDVTLDASDLGTRPDEKAHVKVAFASADRIAAFSGEADVRPMVPSATGRFALSKFSLGLLFPYYRKALAVDVQKGSLDYASAFTLDAAGDLRLTEGEASIADLRLTLPDSREPLWRVPQLALSGVDVDLSGHAVTVNEVRGHGPALRLVRERDGALEMARLLRSEPAPGPTAAPVAAPTAAPAAAPTAAEATAAATAGAPAASTAAPAAERAWTLLAKKLSVDGMAIDVEDRVPSPPVKFAVRELAFTATGNLPGGKSDVTVRAQVGGAGRVAFDGSVDTDRLAVDGRLETTGLALAALQPYIERHVNVIVKAGSLAAKGRLSVTAQDAAPVSATWKGDVALTAFAALDEPTSSDLAHWKTLALDGLDVATAPFRAAVRRIGLDDFYARVIVYPDGSLNLARLLTPGASPEPAPGARAPAPAAAAPGDALPMSIERIDFKGGDVNFTDHFVKPNYSSDLTDVAGSITAMSAAQAGEVALTARLDHSAPVEIRGRIHPFAKDLTLDLSGTARDVDLPSLTPYSAKYAGYAIEKGKLTFDAHYRVENRRLTAENHVTLDQLTFGDHVESPSATTLPVLLAVALLKDSRGVIDVNLPIAGSLDDPQFSVGGLIAKVIVNLIAKAATSPFALLSAAFGGGGEELSVVPFAAGSAALDADAQKRIATLGKALADRPALKLEIAGRADPATDGEVLRRAAVDNALRREKMKALEAAGSAPASLADVTIAADERNRWLAAAYRAAPLADRPRDAQGQLADVPPERMEAMLLAGAEVGDDALRALASARALAVKDAIAAKGVAGERLFLVAPRLGGAASGPATSKPGAAASATAPPTRVDLALR